MLAGQSRAPDAYPDFTIPLPGAISGVGGVEAVELPDRVARTRAHPGAQFLVEGRDRVLQTVLEAVGGGAAEAVARRLAPPMV